jgi:hypothetical protein
VQNGRRKIACQLTQARTPNQNGVAERRNRTIVEKARSMLYDSKIPLFLWPELINSTNYLVNRSSTKANKGMTLEEKYSGKIPRADHLRMFGSLCFVHVPKEDRGKLQSKTIRCMMTTEVKLIECTNLYQGRFLGASMVKWIALNPYEGSTMQALKLFIKFNFFKIHFYKMLRNMLIYKI